MAENPKTILTPIIDEDTRNRLEAIAAHDPGITNPYDERILAAVLLAVLERVESLTNKVYLGR